MKDNSSEYHVFGFALHSHSRRFQLVFGCGAIIVLQFVHGLVQESLFRQPGFKFGAFLSATDLFVYALLSWSSLLLWPPQSSTPLPGGSGVSPPATTSLMRIARGHAVLLLSVSVMLLLNMVLGNSSLHTISYPTKVVFKSSKILPAMLLGAVLQQRKQAYTLVEYLGACVLVIGNHK
jgi:adenosine 3'-phospho 5'-phosphosulfate transporter B3